jgi:thiol-disulfide isomerase/thioredoxin
MIFNRWSIKKILQDIIVTLIIVSIISFGVNYIRRPETEASIPSLKLLSIENRKIDFKLDGKPFIVHFWATWCPICRFEAPNLDSLHRDGIRVITVAVNSGSSIDLRKFMKERGYSYSVINDISGELAKQFKVEAYPTTFIYDSNGTLQFVEVGYSTTIGLKARLALIQ